MDGCRLLRKAQNPAYSPTLPPLEMMSKRWMARNGTKGPDAPPPDAAPGTDIPLPLRLLLSRRGLDPSLHARFVDPSPGELSPWNDVPGMEEAARILTRSAAAGDRILVWGDYDADGMTAAAILASALDTIGASNTIFIPERAGDGYGLAGRAVEICRERGCRTLVTVDCGIGSVDEIAALESAGVTTVITDHHEPGPVLPGASATVNPCMHDGSFPWASLSGAGTAFFLARALEDCSGRVGVFDRALALAAIGTVCDVVPLSGDNRIISRCGLDRLRAGAVPGVGELAGVAGFDISKAAGSDISFRIGPRLNSCGRIASAEPALGLLLAGTAAEASDHAREMEHLNGVRRQLDRKVFEEASAMIGRDPLRPAVFLASRGWHPGVVGIAASRLSSELGRPVVLSAIDGSGSARGSARGVPGINLCEVLSGMSDLLESFGGHAGAAGLSFREASLGDLADRFCDAVAARLPGGTGGSPVLLDGRLTADDLHEGLAEAIGRFEPFGEGNEEPVWITGGASVLSWSRIGGGKHLDCTLGIGGKALRGIGFGLGSIPQPSRGPLDIAYCLRMDEFRGRREMRLHLRDVRPSRPGASS